jgi:hypothetical protein
MWRSKPSLKQTWLRRLKKGGWINRLSIAILKPSLHQSFEEKYTESLEDIHANRSVQQESEKAKKTQGTCGRTSESTSGQLDLFGAFSRTSEVTPRWGYGESCPIWKKMVTKRSGDCSARRKQARLTNASDASSLRNYPTPEAHTVEKYSLQKDGQKKTQRSRNLTAMAINGELDNWATPQASDHIEGARTAKESNQKCLGRDLNQMNWATPNTMDYMETRSAEGVEKIASGARKGRKRPSNLREQVDKKTCDIYKEQNWPTPRAGNPGSRKPGTGGKILAEEAKKNWGTPQARDWKGAQGRAYKGGAKDLPAQTEGVPPHNGPPAPEKSNTSGKNHGSPKLNPNWVEQLMGLKVGWTQLPTGWIDSDS